MVPIVLALVVLAIVVLSGVVWAVGERRRRLSVLVSQQEINAQERRAADAKTDAYFTQLDRAKRDGGLGSIL